ncbi:MAG: leucine-rich repeat protein [Tissierellia bacterium]|nr:leucine-rich repeat protein [Tissierellia bacterium]
MEKLMSFEDYQYVSTELGIKITKFIGDSTKVIIPSMIEGVQVISIGDYAFEKKNLTYVEIPDTVQYIGEGAFSLLRMKLTMLVQIGARWL